MRAASPPGPSLVGMKRPRPQHVAAGLIGVIGLLVAVLIAVSAILASGNIPTAPSSYRVQLVHVAGAAPPAADQGPVAFVKAFG